MAHPIVTFFYLISTNSFVDSPYEHFRRKDPILMHVPRPSDAELRLLHVLWTRGPSTVRQVHEASAGQTGYTTTLKLLQIMHHKSLVSRDASGHAHVYEAAFSRDDLQRSLAADLADRAYAGSAGRLALHALSERGATAEELAEIRTLIKRMEGNRHD